MLPLLISLIVLKSEFKTHHEVNRACLTSLRRDAEKAGTVEVGISEREVSVVEGIQEGRGEIQAYPLCDLRLLDQAEVNLAESWPVDQGTREIAEGARIRRSKQRNL